MQTIMANRKVMPSVCSKSHAAGMPAMLKMGSNLEYHPLSVEMGVSRVAATMDVIHVKINSTNTITASVLAEGDFIKMSIMWPRG